MTLIAKQYLHALGGYAELRQTPYSDLRYMLQINWNMSRIENRSRKILVDYFDDRCKARAAYDSLVTASPRMQSQSLMNWFNALSGEDNNPDIFNGDIDVLKAVFKKDYYEGSISDPHQNATYALHNHSVLFMNNTQDNPVSMRQLLDRICEDLGVVKPDLVIGKEAIETFCAHYGYENTPDFVPDAGGLYICHPLTLILSEPDKGILLHETAHFLEDCMSDSAVYTGHGELFNRIHLQLLHAYAPEVDVQRVFKTAQRLGVFRPEITMDHIMKPIGLLSSEPVLYPYDEPQP